MDTVSKTARKEIVDKLRKRYKDSTKVEKGRILEEFTQMTGCHRKHAIRLLKGKGIGECAGISRGRRVYDEAVKSGLIMIWEAADRICGKRLKAAIPGMIRAMERHGHLKLESTLKEKLLSVSAATIDRMLRSIHESAGPRRKKRIQKRVREEIPIKTFADWKDSGPGYLEIDFVVHGGGDMSGRFLHSLVVTDVCSGWVEAVPLLAREQNLVIEGLKQIGRQMPMPIKGIDSDNDGAFINDTLAIYCKQEGIKFTRSRAYRKNDQAWIEQKNGAVIRKMVGYERYSGVVAGQALAQLLQLVRLYVNYFQPSFKLRERVREGAKIKKFYYPAATPCDRLMADNRIEESVKEALRNRCERLDPVDLLHRIRQGQSALASLSKGEPYIGAHGESLEEFLSGLPQLWQMGEVRPTHRMSSPKARHWRTREDPFKEAWSDILIWLQAEPDITAKCIMLRLKEKDPGQHDEKHLRTLQRRISQWRQSMARELVLGSVEEQNGIQPIGGEVSPH